MLIDNAVFLHEPTFRKEVSIFYKFVVVVVGTKHF